VISTILETMTVTERLLSDCFGGAVRLGDGEDLGGSSRSKVYRFNVLGGPGGMPESVIVKQAQVNVDLAMLTASMRNPGPFLVYTQGDSCPDNCLFVNSRLRLLDFAGLQVMAA